MHNLQLLQGLHQQVLLLAFLGLLPLNLSAAQASRAPREAPLPFHLARVVVRPPVGAAHRAQDLAAARRAAGAGVGHCRGGGGESRRFRVVFCSNMRMRRRGRG